VGPIAVGFPSSECNAATKAWCWGFEKAGAVGESSVAALSSPLHPTHLLVVTLCLPPPHGHLLPAPQFAKAGIPSFVAALPPQARSLYYRDAIGNISSSGAGLCVSLPFERYKPLEGAVRAHSHGPHLLDWRPGWSWNLSRWRVAQGWQQFSWHASCGKRVQLRPATRAACVPRPPYSGQGTACIALIRSASTLVLPAETRRSSEGVRVTLVPRYPLFGGWSSTFTFGYSLPLSSAVGKVRCVVWVGPLLRVVVGWLS